jgi:hypothetical protein
VVENIKKNSKTLWIFLDAISTKILQLFVISKNKNWENMNEVEF